MVSSTEGTLLSSTWASDSGSPWIQYRTCARGGAGQGEAPATSSRDSIAPPRCPLCTARLRGAEGPDGRVHAAGQGRRQEGGEMPENALGTGARPPGANMPSGPGKPPPRWLPASPPTSLTAPLRLTLYPVGLPGGGSQLKWIFRDPAALALGFCGGPRMLWETGNADWVWFWKVRSISSVAGEVGAGQPVGTSPHTADSHSHHQGAREAHETPSCGRCHPPCGVSAPGGVRPTSVEGRGEWVFGETRRRRETVWQPRECSP